MVRVNRPPTPMDAVAPRVLNRRTVAVLLFAGGLLASVAVNWPTLRYGFVYDDYGFVRPYSWHEVLAAFHGPWDPNGPNVAFFRPLTLVFHAVRFEWLQFDPRAYHALSIGLFGVVLGLLATAVHRIANSAMVALLAVAFAAAHPHMPYAATAWVTNQMHLMVLLMFVAALAWWWFCKRRAWWFWLPLLVLQAAAFLLKEDGITLVPVVVVAHVLWSVTERRRVELPPWPFLALAAILLVGGLGWRHLALGGLGGYRTPDWASARANLWRGFWRTLALQPVDRPGKGLATAFVIVTSLLGGLAAACDRRSLRPLFLILLGFEMVAVCNLPYALVTKREQWYLLSLGGAVLLTGATWAMWRALRLTALRAAFSVLIVVVIIMMAWVSRQMAGDFAPYSGYVLDTDRMVAEWGFVSPEIREYLVEKGARWQARREQMPFPQALQMIWCGVYGWESSVQSSQFRWGGRRVTGFVDRKARTISMPVGVASLPGLPPGPSTVTVTVDGRFRGTRALEPERWTTLDLPLPQLAGWFGRRFHRIDLQFDRAVVPARVDPSSSDRRELAVRAGPVTLGW